MARQKNRAKTVQFSKNAIICERDGELCLIVRAVNLRNSLLIDVSVTGKLLFRNGLFCNFIKCFRILLNIFLEFFMNITISLYILNYFYFFFNLGKLLKTRRSLDGEWLALEERNVEFKNSRVLFLTQPVDYVHVIDKGSPLYELSKSVLEGDEPLELIVIMAGKKIYSYFPENSDFFFLNFRIFSKAFGAFSGFLEHSRTVYSVFPNVSHVFEILFR